MELGFLDYRSLKGGDVLIWTGVYKDWLCTGVSGITTLTYFSVPCTPCSGLYGVRITVVNTLQMTVVLLELDKSFSEPHAGFFVQG